jgi:lysophospholipase L1-like esterase
MIVRVTRSRCFLALVLFALLAPAAATARPVSPPAPVRVEVGTPGLGISPTGRPSLLVPVRYPIQLAGRFAETRVSLLRRNGSTFRSWVLEERISGGRIRRPERRSAFTFVHRIGLPAADVRWLKRERMRVRVLAFGKLDADEDGRPELRSIDREAQQPTARPRKRALCSSIAHLRVRTEERVSVPLPSCDTAVRWIVSGRGDRGVARIRHGRLIYRAPQRFRGRDEVGLIGKRIGLGAAASSAQNLAAAYAQVTVGPPAAPLVVRALGDSVTAGFGYYSNGTPMTIGHLLECRPPAKGYDDACSSNSLVTTNKAAKVTYAPDYGLANDVSWAAQWANEHGVTDYANFAVSGSEPADWAPEGSLHETTERIEAEEPDYILMTIGANPLLSEMLTGIDNMGCAVYSEIVGGYSECVERAFAEVHLREDLTNLYADLVKHTDATIYLMQYHLSVPSIALAYSATQIAAMGQLLNREIAAAAAAVDPERLQVVTPPHFDVGIDVSPVYPSRYSCSRLGFKVDGPSVQSTPTQDELDVLHPLSFCEGPVSGPPWVIGGDTGIHPSAAGYAQMASQVPAPS